ncbi:MAG TPA: extracellular solute-binding protein [Candidatus Binataceae bacterium]|nr:extracellular solute-binding protein [Candidatus Binataceae bacterium]
MAPHRNFSRVTALAIAMCCFALPALARAAEPGAAPLTIFHADSLSAYVAELAKTYAAAHPGAQVRSEGSGSLDALRKITDLHLPCDIVLTADWRMLQKPRAAIAPWAAIFAGNSMGLVYSAQSKFARRINPDNWRRVLLQPGVRYGHSDPARDPAGYWTLIVWRLAARFYHDPDLAARLAAGCPRANLRPHNIDLIALLQSGELDYYFGYASDARLGRLEFLALPSAINLGDIDRAADYAQVSVEVGSPPHRKTIVGAPVAYAATMTSNPPNRAGALEFMRLMLGQAGRKAARHAGLIAYQKGFAWDPARRMPRELRAITQPLGAN